MHNKRLTAIAIVTSGALLMSGCQITQEDTGRVVGSVAGGLLGNQVGKGSGRLAATIAGTMLGGMMGGEIGRQMDENDRYRANRALETAPTNRTTTWSNPDTGTDYAVTPTRTYFESDQPCREYRTEAWIGGKKETVYGTACRQADGSWQVAN